MSQIAAARVYREVIVPTLQTFLPAKMDSPAARIMLVATGLQESEFEHRFQVLKTPGLKGPARSFWQFERGGGCLGVLRHPASAQLMEDICRARKCVPTPGALWVNMENDDVLACCAARLLYWTDPKPLPMDHAGGWDLYMRTWRPGKPKPNKWPGHYGFAKRLVLEEDL